jgi:pilus assembly protein FimV
MPGDTASKIAAATKPAKVSLDQMLVALLHTNPAAFTGDNVNRIKAGALINIPSAEQVAAVSPTEATQIVVAQSRDFNDFRRKLAGNAPATAVATADRKVSGNLQARVEDKKAVTTAPDKLTLSKGAVQKQAAENQLASERNAKEAASRAAEIAKNISDLSKLGAASSAVASGPAAPAVKAVSPVPSVASTVITTAAPPASAPANLASTALPQPVVAAASAPTQPTSAVVKHPLPVPAPRAEVGLVDGLIENPLVPAGAIGLIAVLAFFGFYRSRQRKNASRVDSIFLESRLRPDSFFGASGGQSVDTNDNAAPGSSMVYSTSQLDAVDNVDPVAEADVYLAYGRDLQAEEILKDALRSNPGRIAIHQKLLDIFAKRLDSNSFENIASSAFKVTGGEGPDWVRICELGLSIDPTNDLYLPGGQPRNPDGTPSRPASLDFISNLAASSDTLANQDAEPQVASVDLDLDLDFSLDEQHASHSDVAPAGEDESATTPLDLDFGLATAASPIEPYAAGSENATSDTHADQLSQPSDDITREDSMTEPSVDNEDFKAQAAASFGATAPAPLSPSAPSAPPAPGFGMLEFDLGSLSLDLGDTLDTVHKSVAESNQDPLSTKLALAEEFSAMGDDDGARALIQEVISEASGDMKAKAQNALNNL